MIPQPGLPGHLTDLITELREITEAVDAGNTWAEVGAGLDPPMPARLAKRHAHKLREQIAQELRKLSEKLAAAGARNGGWQGPAGDGEG